MAGGGGYIQGGFHVPVRRPRVALNAANSCRQSDAPAELGSPEEVDIPVSRHPRQDGGPAPA